MGDHYVVLLHSGLRTLSALGAPGRKTYIVDERNTVYVRDLGHPGGVDHFPTGEELRQFWKVKH